MPTPTFTIAELVTPVSRSAVEATIYRVLASVGVDVTAWKPGAVVRAEIAASSIVLSALSTLQALIARSGFLEFASGDWLSLIAYYVYRVTKIEASPAAGLMSVRNDGGGVFSLDALDVIFSDASGRHFRNTSAFALGSTGSGTSTVTVPAVADVAGSIGSAAANTITTLATPLINVSCTNPSALVGTDEESDPALRERCYEALGALSPMGPWDAYTSAARGAKRADETSLGVSRVRVAKDGLGNVFVFLASASGGLTGDASDPDSDVGIAHAAILRWAQPECVTAHTIGAADVPIAITYEVWMYNTAVRTDDEVQALISQALSTFMSTQPIGGTAIGGSSGKLFVDAIRATIKAALPGEIFHVELIAPSTDIELDVSPIAQVGVIDGAPLATIHQQPRPAAFGGAN